jgi:hypothetical protein
MSRTPTSPRRPPRHSGSSSSSSSKPAAGKENIINMVGDDVRAAAKPPGPIPTYSCIFCDDSRLSNPAVLTIRSLVSSYRSAHFCVVIYCRRLLSALDLAGSLCQQLPPSFSPATPLHTLLCFRILIPKIFFFLLPERPQVRPLTSFLSFGLRLA